MNKKETQKLLALIMFLLVFTVAALIFLFSFLSDSNPQRAPEDLSNIAEPGVAASSLQEQKQEEVGFQVGLLINQLPYRGQYFSLYYNLEKDVFTLFINPQHTQEGNAQFIDFLKKNGIENQSALQSLNTVYKEPTPQP